MSKVIKSELAEKYHIRTLVFPKLDGPLPEPRRRGDSFIAADYFKERSSSKQDNFAPSFGPKKEKPSQKEEPPPLPLTPEQILEQARTEAASLVEKAQGEAEAIREEAREKGRAKGLEAGQAELEALKEDAVSRLLGAAQGIENTRDEVLKELEEELVRLVTTASSKIVAQELKINPEVIKSVVMVALKLISRTRSVKIRINPQDLEMVEAIRPRIQVDFPDLGKVDLVPDEDVTQGGCMVITESEEIDDTVETRLQNMAQTMDSVLKGIDDEH